MRRRHKIIGLLAIGLGVVTAASCVRDSVPQEAARPVAEASRLARVASEVRDNPALTEINRVEDVVGQIERELLRPWTVAWRRGVAAPAIRASEAVTPDWSAAVRTPTRALDGVSEYRLTAPDARDERAGAYLAQFARVADVSLRVDDATVSGDVARLHVRFDLRGELASGARRTDRGALNLEARRVGATWKVARVSIDGALESIEAAAGRRPTYEDRTAASGLGAVPVVERREAIRRGGYALAVEDLDGDGNNDVLVGHADSARFYRGVGGGRFVDATAAVGIAGVTLVKSAAIADLDRDGRRDLLLVRFVDAPEAVSVDQGDPFNGRAGDGEILAFANRGERFDRVRRVLQRNHHYDRAMPLSVADFDSDGALDVYVGFPGVRDFTNNLNRTGGEGVMRQGLWRNQGGWSFVESPMAEGMRGDGQRFPHASLATDLDGDGRPELVVVDDSGQPNVVYRNDGRELHESATAMNLSAPGWGMGATSGDFDGDGDLDLAMTNITSAVFDRVLRTVSRIPLSPEARRAMDYEREGVRGLRLYRNDGRGRFEEVTELAGLRNVGEAPAGAEWVDYNHDGWLDLYVANGLWTGDRDGDDLTSTFYRLAIARALSDRPKPDSAMSEPGDRDPNPLLTILRGFRGRFDGNTASFAPNGPTLSFAGGEHHRLYRNNGDGTFTEVGYLENADRTDDGYVIAPADLDGDGVVDLALRNCDPAPRQNFPAVVFLRNTRPAQHTLRVTLRGTRDNPDGLGARIVVRVGERTIVREVRGANGAAQGEAAVTFGLGSARGVDAVEVRWPSGAVQRLGVTPEGRVTIAQPG